MGFMNIFRKFGKRADTSGSEDETSYEDIEWDKITTSRNELNIKDAVQRREYVQNCLIQMGEGSAEIESLQFEYRTVTKYLHDMDEIDGLPPEQLEKLRTCAQKIEDSSQRREQYLSQTDHMTDAEYDKIDRISEDTNAILFRIADTEDYQKRIRNDLSRLDAERQAYNFRKDELDHEIDNTKGLIIFTGVSFVILILMLFILHSVLKLEVLYGYMLTAFIVVITVFILYIRNTNALREKKNVSNAMVRLIQLQNTVKIRYVNNTNLLDYLYLKYGVSSSDELSKLIERYNKEKDRREVFKNAEKLLDSNQQELLFMLRSYNISDPDIWLHQTSSLISHNEEVETRHSLIVRRQSLRKRMDYNREIVIENARKEISDLASLYPQYAGEILDQVNRFQAEKGLS